MAVPAQIAALIGTWRGTNHLWLSPGEPVRKSESRAEITTVAQEQFADIRYTWADKGKPQEGRLIIGQETEHEIVRAVWLDSWHMMDKFMICEGSIMAEGTVSVKGSYAAPPGPDWGWQIDIEPQENDSFRFAMHNISPEGEKMLAVEVIYSRQD